MSKEPLVTVLLPVYNAEQYIAEALKSVLNQSFKDFEILVLDDCSTDESPNIIKSFNDDRIIYIRNEENLRLIRNLNKGISLAQGRYIARMDADDICDSRRFEQQVRFLETHVDVSMVGCLGYIIDSDGKILHKTRHFMTTNGAACKFACFYESQFIHPATMFRASALKQFKYSESLKAEHVEDRDLWIRMFLAGHKMVNLPDYLFYYRVHKGSICDENKIIQIQKANDIAIEYVKDYFHSEELSVLYQNSIFSDDIMESKKCMQRMLSAFINIERCSFKDRRAIYTWMGKYMLEHARGLSLKKKFSLFLSDLKSFYGGVSAVFFVIKSIV